jgi:hypothetical protein
MMSRWLRSATLSLRFRPDRITGDRETALVQHQGRLAGPFPEGTMAAQATPDSGLRCRQCGRPHHPHDRFCGRCRTELHGDPAEISTTVLRPEPPADRFVPQPRPAPGRRPDATAGTDPTETTDATTRYLCAAAHLDRDFADTAIREYPLEPTRAVPPTPGLDAVAVLKEAVAARTRRKIRDTVLLVLLTGFAWMSPP